MYLKSPQKESVIIEEQIVWNLMEIFAQSGKTLNATYITNCSGFDG